MIAKDMAMMLIATAILVVGVVSDSFDRTFGLGMFAILVVFVFYQFKSDNIVLDADCKAYDQGDLYVADASIIPTSIGVNPSLAIAANAKRLKTENTDRSQ